MSLKTTRVRPKRKGVIGSLENVGGQPLHVHVEQFVNSLDASTVTDEKNKRYFKVESVQRYGRAVSVIGEAGYYGEAGNTYDVKTGIRVHARKDDEASTARTRTTLFVPPFADVAVFAIESRRGIPNGNLFIDAFLQEMRSRYETLFFPTETVLEQDAWSAAGNLKAIQVVRRSQPMNYSSGIDTDRSNELVVGDLIFGAEPPKGMRYWPKHVWDRIRGGQLDAAVFLRARTEEQNADPDENVLVTIERDNRQKTFELGSDGKPSVREVLTTSGQNLLSDDEFLERASDAARGIYADMDKDWNSSWLDSKWPEAWVQFKWRSGQGA
ncbi:hypothetical protein [Mycetocola saprophilus]|uniref:hypothetical protein n=1 Tax=Mycetocola saprophilus TaxID=76636 RepID=UPI003BF4E4D7